MPRSAAMNTPTRVNRTFAARLERAYEEHFDITSPGAPVPSQDSVVSSPSDLTAEELEQMHSSAGELGWITRQLRCDWACENGVAQRSKSDACVTDLLQLKQCIGLSRRGADFRLRYWADVGLSQAVLIHLADSGHANGTQEGDEKVRYRSVGGCSCPCHAVGAILQRVVISTAVQLCLLWLWCFMVRPTLCRNHDWLVCAVRWLPTVSRSKFFTWWWKHFLWFAVQSAPGKTYLVKHCFLLLNQWKVI